MIGKWVVPLSLMSTLPAVALAKPTAAELAAVGEAEARGAEMYAYDQAAWHATDRFQEDIARQAISLTMLREKGLEGYIIEPGEGGSLTATFYGIREDRRFAIARYTVSGSTVTGGGFVAPDGARDLSLLAQRMIDGRRAALAAMARPDHGLCSQSPPNTLVLPPRADGTMPVYVLTSTTVASIYPAGGHFRFDFDAAGKLVGERRFMKSCFDLNLRGKDGGKAEAVFLTHLLDPQPTEIHAFVSRNLPIALMIATVSNRELWRIGNGDIEYLSDIPADK